MRVYVYELPISITDNRPADVNIYLQTIYVSAIYCIFESSANIA